MDKKKPDTIEDLEIKLGISKKREPISMKQALSNFMEHPRDNNLPAQYGVNGHWVRKDFRGNIEYDHIKVEHLAQQQDHQ